MTTNERERVQHTPGEWEDDGVGVYEACRKETHVGDDGRVFREGLIAIVYERYGVEDGEIPTNGGNRLLVASAPNLLAASIAVLNLLESEGRDTGIGGPVSDLRDAIAKATGKQ